MADLEQGIKYTIEADASKAEQSLKDIGKQAAENGQQIEKAMAGANAVTAALNGNFVAAVSSLGRMTKAVSGLGKMIAGATVWVAVIGAVVSVFHKWREKVAETKAKIEEFKQVRFDRHIAEMKKAQEEMAKAIDETVSAIDRQLDADTRSLTLAKEKIKAQIELNRQKELEGKSDEKKKAINAAADAKLADAERKFADSKLAAEIAANANRTEALRKLLRRQDRDAASNQRSYSSAVGDYQRIEREELEKMVAERTWNTKSQLQYLKSYRGNVRGSSREQVDARIAELEAKLKSDTADYLRRLPASMEFQGRLGKRDDYASARRRAEELGGLVTTDSDRRKKIFSAISESEEKAKELAKQKEIDKIKTKAAVQAEKNVQVELGKVRLEAAKEQARKTSLAEAKRAFSSRTSRSRTPRRVSPPPSRPFSARGDGTATRTR